MKELHSVQKVSGVSSDEEPSLHRFELLESDDRLEFPHAGDAVRQLRG